ncbi:serine hydrolase [Clostridium rectalis]|uniref:serine hydrolase n=1 Tax=Clostridium rectalis TaxID=2040295 RepID=UPI0019D0FC77|nr:serine hydrolase [Clostridium rectalis]
MLNLDKITPDLQSLINDLKGTCGLYIKDLQNNEEYSFNKDVIFPSASIIKLFIMYKLFENLEKGIMSLNDKITLKECYKVGGFGILKNLDENLQLTLKDLVTLMITLSDNTATNMLIDLLGMETINEDILSSTCLQRKMMDSTALKKGLDNFTSPMDVCTVLEKILYTDSISETNKKIMLDILKKQQCNNKLPVNISNKLQLAHKTGDLPGVEHDAGILFYKNQAFIIVVLTKDLENNTHGVQFNNKIGRLLSDSILNNNPQS